MKATHIASALILAAGVVGSAACSSQPTAGGATARFNPVTGILRTTVEAPLDKAWSAAQAAVEDLEFTISNRAKDALTGIVQAETADRSDIRIHLESRTANTTDVTVNVGPFGKQATAQLLLENIQRRL